jgi:PAS domain S-box-containing protein
MFQLVAYTLIIFRGSIPDWISVEAGNLISVAGIFIGYIGLEKYTGRSITKIPDYILFTLMAFFFLWFTFIRPLPATRYVIITASYSVLFAQCAWLMTFGVSGNMAGLTRFTGLVCAGLSLLSVVKTVSFFLSGEKPADYFQSGTFEAITMIVFAMLIVILTISIAIMLNYNLLRDIRTEEEKFSTVFLTAPNAIILSSYPEGRIMEVNDRFVELSGYDFSEVKGRLPNELGLWAIETERQEVDRELQEKGIISRKECRFRRKTQDLITVLFSTKVISVKNGMIYLSSIYDITERKELQDQIRHERNLLRTLVDHLPDPVSIKDSEGRYILNNKAHLQVLGAETQEEVLGKSAFDFFNEEDAAIYVADDSIVLKTGKLILDKTEFAKHLETGFPYWHMTSKIPIKDDNGKAVQILTISHDITERKRAEDILKETDEFNRSLLMTIPFGMDVVDETGTVLFMGEKFRRMFGNDAIGKKCWELYCDSSVQCAGCPLKSGIKTGTTSSYEAHGILGGKIFDINHTGMVFHGKNAMLEIFHDITERKKSEGDLIRSKEKAEESDRLKTAFLHNISHEIRTPMNAIVGFANLMREPGLSQEDRDSYTEIISRSSHHLLSIVNDVIEISNVEAGRLKITLSDGNLDNILEDLYTQFRTLASENNIDFSKDAPANRVSKIKTDCTKFIQILTNLLNNAFKFTYSGKIRFGYNVREPFLEFYVSDTGIGIDEDHQQKIFDRFYQVDNTVTRAHEGTGIGLSISKAYVENLGGQIWLNSVPGKGSTFYFTIPVLKDTQGNDLQIQV